MNQYIQLLFNSTWGKPATYSDFLMWILAASLHGGGCSLWKSGEDHDGMGDCNGDGTGDCDEDGIGDHDENGIGDRDEGGTKDGTVSVWDRPVGFKSIYIVLCL